MRLPECIVCGEPMGGMSTGWVHSRCATGQGWDLRESTEDWPEWAMALRLDEERQRENEGWRMKRNIEIVSLDEIEEWALVVGEV